MKTIKDKQVLVAADFAGVTLKNAIVKHLEAKGWEVTDIGVKTEEDEHPEMFHRIGLKVGAKIAEGEFERALIFCGTGMGIHIAASKCPHVHAAVVESVPAALRCSGWPPVRCRTCSPPFGACCSRRRPQARRSPPAQSPPEPQSGSPAPPAFSGKRGILLHRREFRFCNACIALP